MLGYMCLSGVGSRVFEVRQLKLGLGCDVQCVVTDDGSGYSQVEGVLNENLPVMLLSR